MRRAFASRWYLAALAGAVALLVTTALVSGFGEEILPFVDPSTGQTFSGTEVSSVHNDLTYALALAAGFSVADAQRLQIWNQLVDSEQLGPGGSVVYSNCLGSFPPTPVPTDVCPAGTDTEQVAWPAWSEMKDPTRCVTSRFGPYSALFHFPHDSPQEIGAIRDWAWGVTDRLVGYEAYAWGGPTVLQSTCAITRTATVDIGIAAGSLEAFATYIHALGDVYSHKDCVDVLDSLGVPWGTHSVVGIPECAFQSHTLEFGRFDDAARTEAAARHIYAELAERSLWGEGQFWPLSLETRLNTISGTLTLSDTLSIFVHDWNYLQPQQRRSWAAEIARAVLEVRQPTQRSYLPLLPVQVASPGLRAPSSDARISVAGRK